MVKMPWVERVKFWAICDDGWGGWRGRVGKVGGSVSAGAHALISVNMTEWLVVTGCSA